MHPDSDIYRYFRSDWRIGVPRLGNTCLGPQRHEGHEGARRDVESGVLRVERRQWRVKLIVIQGNQGKKEHEANHGE